MSRFVLLLFVTVVSLGCGRRAYPVEGAVTFDGKPLEGGTIAFDTGEAGQPEVTQPIVNGRYATTLFMSGEPRGVAVRIVGHWKTGRKIPVGPPAPPSELTDEIAQTPQKFNQPGAFTISPQPGEASTFDFALKKS